MGVDMCNSKLYAAGGPIPASQPIKRALFGHPDKEETLAFLRKETKIFLEEQNARWNFDFLEERPLPGPFVWEPVTETSSSSSSVYVPITATPVKIAPATVKKVTKSIRSAKKSPKNAMNRVLRNLAADQRDKQSSITDFMSKMKGGMKKPAASE